MAAALLSSSERTARGVEDGHEGPIEGYTTGTMELVRLLKTRRSHYQIGPSSSPFHTPAALTPLISACLRYTPSMFNMQSTRIVILYGARHRAFWDMVGQGLGEEVPRMRPNVAWEYFSTVQEKLDSLARGIGTVVFYTDPEVVASTCTRYPKYAPSIPTWASQAAAMAQYAVWLALTSVGSPGTSGVPRVAASDNPAGGERSESDTIGATLQHYPLDRDWMARECGVPAGWTCDGQMPFGLVVGEVVQKELRGVGELVTVLE